MPKLTTFGLWVAVLFWAAIGAAQAQTLSRDDVRRQVESECAETLKASGLDAAASDTDIASAIWRNRFEETLSCLTNARRLSASAAQRLDLAAVWFVRLNYETFACGRAEHGEDAARFANGFMLEFMIPALRTDLNLSDTDARLKFAAALRQNSSSSAIFRASDPTVCKATSEADRKFAKAATIEFVERLSAALPDPGSVGISTTWQDMPTLGVSIGVELRSISHLNEYDRTLIVRRGDEQYRYDLVTDWGPADWVGLYEAPEGRLGIIQAEGTANLISIGAKGLLPSGDVAGWRFIGAFDMLRLQGRRQVGPFLVFLPASERGECFAAFDGEGEAALPRPAQSRTLCTSAEYVLQESGLSDKIFADVSRMRGIAAAKFDSPNVLLATEPLIIARPDRVLGPRNGLAIQVIDSIAQGAWERSAELVASIGIAEFWAIDPRSRTTLILEGLRDGRYQNRRRLSFDEPAQSRVVPALTLRLSQLTPEKQ